MSKEFVSFLEYTDVAIKVKNKYKLIHPCTMEEATNYLKTLYGGNISYKPSKTMFIKIPYTNNTKIEDYVISTKHMKEDIILDEKILNGSPSVMCFLYKKV